MPPAIAEVQVASSEPVHVREDLVADSETEDEGDVDSTPAATHTTPATSRPSVMKEVKETPVHHKDRGGDVLSSTAHELSEDVTSGDVAPLTAGPSSEIEITAEDITNAGAGSPAAERGQRSQDLLQTANGSPAAASSQAFPSTPNAKMFNNEVKRGTASQQEELPRMSKEHQAGDGQQDDSASSTMLEPRTSEAMFPDGVAREAAVRSLPDKRKRDDPEDATGVETTAKARKVSHRTEAEDRTDAGEGSVRESVSTAYQTEVAADEISARRRNTATSATANKMDGSETNIDDDEDSDDNDPSQIEAGPKIGRLARIARTDDSDSEVVVSKPKKQQTVQKKRSPEVVVPAKKHRKSSSKTPAGTQTTTNASSLTGKAPKILASGHTLSHPKFMKAQGCSVIDAVGTRRTNFVCVVADSNTLSKTPKVLRSLALGKLVVTERWVKESAAAEELLDPAGFVHQEFAETMDIDRRKLFFGKVLYFTSAAEKEYGKANWLEMQELAAEAGATAVESGTGSKGGKMLGHDTVIFLGTPGDADVTTLIEEHERVVYHKDLVKDAIVSGVLDLEDDKYMLTAGKKKSRRR